MRATTIFIPTLVRIKPGAISRIGLYAKRGQFRTVLFLQSKGLLPELSEQVEKSLVAEGITIAGKIEVERSSFEQAEDIFQNIPKTTDLIIGLGGGKAMDVAKYAAFLSRLPYIAMPTSLSNDGFCSPQSSLEYKGKRKSFPASMPYGVVIDTEVCLQAPQTLWLSGIGDIVSKITAIYDWKLAFHAQGAQIDDLAALLSDATVFQLMAKPERDLEGMRLLGTALMLNGVAMEICGSSRPASGSEHLVSHALDLHSKRPRLHGLQVGMASYIISSLQGKGKARIDKLFKETGFWEAIRQDPFNREEWIAAFKAAPYIKENFYTILSAKDYTQELTDIIDNDSILQGLFV